MATERVGSLYSDGSNGSACSYNALKSCKPYEMLPTKRDDGPTEELIATETPSSQVPSKISANLRRPFKRQTSDELLVGVHGVKKTKTDGDAVEPSPSNGNVYDATAGESRADHGLMREDDDHDAAVASVDVDMGDDKVTETNSDVTMNNDKPMANDDNRTDADSSFRDTFNQSVDETERIDLPSANDGKRTEPNESNCFMPVINAVQETHRTGVLINASSL